MSNKIEYRARPLSAPQVKTLAEGEGWEFDALAVPWNTWDNTGFCMEQMAAHSLTPSKQGVKLRFEHETTIGIISDIRDEKDGLYITGRISDTAAGRDARTLLNDNAITGLSIGFIPTGEPQITYEDETTYITQTAGELLEVSLVTFPAYKDTHITEIRKQSEKEENKMPNNTPSVDFERLERSIDLINEKLSEKAEAAPAAMSFRSFGAYARALASENPEALRAYNGATTGDDKTLRPAWLNRTMKKMVEKQRVTSLFTHTNTLPKDGMSVEFPQFGDDGLVVEKQKKEGDALPYGKITITTGSAPVNTYGGYSTVSKQQIERGSDVYLSTLFERQALHYAREIEKATRELFTATVKQNLASTPLATGKELSAVTVNDLIAVLVDAAQYYDETDVNLDGILVSADVLKHLASLEEAPKALKFVTAAAGDNTQGAVNIPALQGSISSIPVTLIPGDSVFCCYSSSALEVHESAGAPLRLQDESIIDLTKAFSVYGYAAHFVSDTEGIVPIKLGAK